MKRFPFSWHSDAIGATENVKRGKIGAGHVKSPWLLSHTRVRQRGRSWSQSGHRAIAERERSCAGRHGVHRHAATHAMQVNRASSVTSCQTHDERATKLALLDHSYHLLSSWIDLFWLVLVKETSSIQVFVCTRVNGLARKLSIRVPKGHIYLCFASSHICLLGKQPTEPG